MIFLYQFHYFSSEIPLETQGFLSKPSTVFLRSCFIDCFRKSSEESNVEFFYIYAFRILLQKNKNSHLFEKIHWLQDSIINSSKISFFPDSLRKYFENSFKKYLLGLSEKNPEIPWNIPVEFFLRRFSGFFFRSLSGIILESFPSEIPQRNL